MALPAGRYGVTKNQLLKIKKLPMNTMGMIKDTKEGIAIIEDGAKASQLIIAGRQFWHNGKLYSADVDIAKDADIITSGEGKNATEMPNITDQLPGTDVEKANEVSIAFVENGSTPSATINAGEQFYHNGVLYTATADITTADTFIVYPAENYNCKLSDSVTGQIKAVKESKADNSVIAPVENGTTASQAYAIGSHAIRNGAFITWKNAKAQGETINDASDYTSGDVADEFGIVEELVSLGVKNIEANSQNTFSIPSKTGYRILHITCWAGGSGAGTYSRISLVGSGTEPTTLLCDNKDASDHTWQMFANITYKKVSS